MEGSKEQVELLMMYEEIKKERDQYKRERDELLKEVEKISKLKEMREKALKGADRIINNQKSTIEKSIRQNQILQDQADEYYLQWQAELEQRIELSYRWSKLDDYVKERREVNPASIQYIKIEGMIRELEGGEVWS